MQDMEGSHVALVYFSDLHQMRSAAVEMDKHRISVNNSSRGTSFGATINVRAIEVRMCPHCTPHTRADNHPPHTLVAMTSHSILPLTHNPPHTLHTQPSPHTLTTLPTPTHNPPHTHSQPSPLPHTTLPTHTHNPPHSHTYIGGGGSLCLRGSQ